MPNGFATTLCYTTYGSQELVDAVQMTVKFFKDVGIEVTVDRETVRSLLSPPPTASSMGLMIGPQLPAPRARTTSCAQYLPGEPKNQSHVNDRGGRPTCSSVSRTLDEQSAARSSTTSSAHRQAAVLRADAVCRLHRGLEPALKNFGPNLGYDYGGRLMAAVGSRLDRRAGWLAPPGSPPRA